MNNKELSVKYFNAPIVTEPRNPIVIDNFLPEDFWKVI